ncbi:MAG: gliding motility-associated C-terminal domain-containing protein [Flavobacteriia bacterium]
MLQQCVFGQVCVYQDIFKGGVTGDGNTSWFYNDPCTLNINIEANSSIRKAFLFVNVYNEPVNRVLNFNGNEIFLDENDAFANIFLMNINNTPFSMRTLIFDVTSFVSPTNNTYTIIPPQNQPSPNLGGAFSDFYLYVTYDNPNLSKINSSIFLNKQNAEDLIVFPILNINPIDLNQNVALAIHSQHFCNIFEDGSFILIDNVNIGLLGGDEDNNNVECSGVTGSFYYENGTSFGLGNDTADPIMNGNDGLANIETNVTNPIAFTVSFDYQSNKGPQSNPVFELFFAYASPCDTFSFSVPNDTTVCKNQNVQLFATGGIQYLWQPAEGLSCTDCPNPVFMGDSSRVYTVQIWSTDSCSVISPVSMGVYDEPSLGAFSLSKPDCGANNGILEVSINEDSIVSYQLDTQSIQNNGLFDSLAKGQHTIFFTDKNGCSSDSTFTIADTIRTYAFFTASSSYGFIPLSVSFDNLSTNATNYLWEINDNETFSALPNYVFDSSGYYEITLFAWQYDVSCIDSFSLKITAYDYFIYQIPNIFTPNADGINDEFGITSNIPISVKYEIYNRWGEVITYGTKEWSSSIIEEFYELWGGYVMRPFFSLASDGVYFYKMEISAFDKNLNPKILDLFPIKKEGFFHLEK